MMMKRTPFRILVSLFALAVVLVANTGSAFAQEKSLADRLRDLTHHTEEGVEAADMNNPVLMGAEAAELEAFWSQIEDDVRAADPGGYAEIETALDAVNTAVKANPVDAAQVKLAYEHLADEITEVADTIATGTTASSSGQATATTPAELLALLDSAAEETSAGNASEAAAQIQAFILSWPAVEGDIATRSHDAYVAIEGGMGQASAALQAEPADFATATTAIASMQASLSPLVDSVSYSWIDAAAIILREGLEALLVIVALLSFLKRSNNEDKRGWIWAGGALGVLFSIAAAFVLQAVFSTVAAGRNRELIEGWIGLIAAGMLFYVSYWLHSKASIKSWQRYINDRTTQALASGSLFGLALLSFLAVFREGAETAVFYLGMAPAIAPGELLLGIGVGVVVLAVAALLMLGLGVRLPLRQFFQVAGLLVYYLGFKFIGTGIHALQVAGVLPTSPIGWLPTLEPLGIFPTWQGVLPQVLVLLLAVGLVAWGVWRARGMTQAPAAA